MERIMIVTGASHGDKSLEDALNALVGAGNTVKDFKWKERAGYWVIWYEDGVAPPATTTVPPVTTTLPPTTTAPPTTTEPPVTTPPPTTPPGP